MLAALLLLDALELGTGAAPAARPRETVRIPFAREVVGRRSSAATSPPAAPASDSVASPAQRRLEAEQCFRKAQQLLGSDKQLLGSDKQLEAAKLLRRAVELEPGEPEYALFEAWVSYQEVRQGVRVARTRAATAARKLLAADPKAARVRTILGRLALDEGDRERAAREFELALLSDPEDEEASRGLKQARA